MLSRSARASGVGDMVSSLLNHLGENCREFLAEHGKSAPIGCAADPLEIAGIVAFLALRPEESSASLGTN